jgi:hypothetical protein
LAAKIHIFFKLSKRYGEKLKKNLVEMPFISKLLLTFAPLLNRERDVDNEISDYLWTIHHADGSYFFASRTDEDVPEAVCEGDGPVGCQFHRHRPADIFLHRRCDLYPDEAEYPESLDAAMGVGLYYPRNPVTGVLQFYHVSDPGGKGGLEYRL